MLHRPFPVGVLVDYRRQDLCLMVRVRITHEFPQDFCSPVSLDPVLRVIRSQSEVRL